MFTQTDIHLHGEQHSVKVYNLDEDYLDPSARYVIKLAGETLGSQLTIYAEFSQVKHLAQKLLELIDKVESGCGTVSRW